MAFTIRQLRPNEAEIYRDIRLEALRLNPEAFGASFDAEATEPLAFFTGRLAANAVFGGFLGQNLLGTAGLVRHLGAKNQHKGQLVGMYVRPAVRSSGLGKALAEAILDHAAGRVELVQLAVVTGNPVALRLYRSLGFEPYGTEARALKVDGRYFDEILMARILA